MIPKLKRSFTVFRAVGFVTLTEFIRDNIFYNLLFFAVGLIFLGLIASRLTFIQPDRVVLDFGLSAINLGGAALAILFGSSSIGKEFERRTAFVALSRPISRGQFVVGKFLGLVSLLLINQFFWTLIYLVCLGFASFRGFFFHFHSSLALGLFLFFIQSAVLASVSVFFSTFTTSSLAVLFSIGLYLIGTSISSLQLALAKFEVQEVKSIAQGVASLFPNFEAFNLGLQITYGFPVSLSYVAGTLGYALAWILILLFGASRLVSMREL